MSATLVIPTDDSAARPAPPGPRARRSQPPPKRLGPRTRKLWLIVHVVSSVALLGACASTLVTGLTAAMSEDAEFARSAYELMESGTTALGIPFSMLALASGLVLGLRGKWGLLKYRWVVIKLVALPVVVLLGAVGLGNVLATLAASPDPGAESIRYLAPAISASQIALLFLSTALSVTKPAARTKRLRLLPRR